MPLICRGSCPQAAKNTKRSNDRFFNILCSLKNQRYKYIIRSINSNFDLMTASAHQPGPDIFSIPIKTRI
ncbi:MAG: hypothetical protein ACYTE5_09520, partial [Planctomycetota bacterium]